MIVSRRISNSDPCSICSMIEYQAYATLNFFFSVVPLFFRIFFFLDFAGIATAVPFPLIDAERRCYQVRDRDRQSWFIFREHILRV